MTLDAPGPPDATHGSTAAFADVLRSAIEDSGLGLARVRHHVARRGLAVSTATLSHWQTGRSVPERPQSLRVVVVLEEVLGLAPGELRSLVPEPRPRGRGSGVTPSTAGERVGPYWDEISRAAASMSLALDDAVRLVSSHQVLELGADRVPVRHVVRHVVRSVVDGMDRVPVYYCDEVAHPVLPRIHPTIGCTLGRERHVEPIGLTVTELLLAAPLAAGTRSLVEYEVEHVPEPPTSSELTMSHPVREAVVVVRFSPDALPAVVEARLDDGGSISTHRIRLDAHGVASVARHDLRPGSVGLHWTWPQREGEA